MDTNTIASLKDISQTDWANFGLNHIAYLRPVVVDGQAVFAIHAADGSQLALVATRDVGLTALEQHDLEPVALH